MAEIHNDGRHMHRHAHDDPHFWLMIRGRYRVEGTHCAETIGPGSLVYTAAGEDHRDHIKCRTGFGMTIAIGSAFVRAQLGGTKLPSRSAILSDPHIVWTAQRLRGELRGGDQATGLLVSGLSLELLGQLCRLDSRPSAGRSLTDRARILVDERFSSPGLSVAALAQELGTHPVHLARSFRMALGVAPADYVRSYRCRRAAEMLRSGEVSLVEIALGCGFGDQSSFTRAFRKAFGTTPAAFRRASR